MESKMGIGNNEVAGPDTEFVGSGTKWKSSGVLFKRQENVLNVCALIIKFFLFSLLSTFHVFLKIAFNVIS